MLTNKFIEQESFKLLILINDAGAFKVAKALQTSFQSIIDVLKVKMEASKLPPDELSDEQKKILESFIGPDFPNDDELERVTKLAEYCLNNYRVVDPKDEVPRKHE